MIKSWLEDDFNISDQRKELEWFFVKVAAVRDISVSIEKRQLKVLGTRGPARMFGDRGMQSHY